MKEVLLEAEPREITTRAALNTTPEAASIFSGLQVARYKRLPRRVVCGLAALPVVGMLVPIAFLFMNSAPR